MASMMASQPGHQPAHRVAVEESQAQPLQLGKDLGAQVEHDPLANPGREDRLRVAEQQSEH
jgi:hypothetical protein